MNTLYKRNDIKQEGYILNVGDDNNTPICIQEDAVYLFGMYDFGDALKEFPEYFTKLGEVEDETLVNAIANYTWHKERVDELENTISNLVSDKAVSRYDDWYNNGGHLPEDYVTPEEKKISACEKELNELETKYEAATGKKFTNPSDIFTEISQVAQQLQTDLQEEQDEPDR